MSITVITGTLPERRDLLDELAQSIRLQDVRPDQWLIGFDDDRRGTVRTFNKLASQVGTEWLFPMGDDDLFYPHHFATLAPHLTNSYDVVYTWCETDAYGMAPDIWQVPFDKERLRTVNTIPGAAAIRTSLWKAVGGYPHLEREEDYGFWLRALAEGARFKCVPEVTWLYRLGGDWPHRTWTS